MEIKDFIENEYYLWDWKNSQCIMLCIKVNDILKLKVVKDMTHDCGIHDILDIKYQYDACRPLTQLEKIKYL